MPRCRFHRILIAMATSSPLAQPHQACRPLRQTVPLPASTVPWYASPCVRRRWYCWRKVATTCFMGT